MKSVTKATRNISSFCETIPNTTLGDPWCHNEQILRPVGHTYQRISFKNMLSGTVSSGNKKKKKCMKRKKERKTVLKSKFSKEIRCQERRRKHSKPENNVQHL